MIYCNFRTSSEIHPNLERMGESFEHIITVRARGGERHENNLECDQVKFKILCI